MTKVEIDGKTYCVETLIYTVERLTKEVKASAEYHRLVLDKIRAEIKALPRELPTDARNMVRRTRVLEIIDKYTEGVRIRMTCDDCIHKSVCYRIDSVSPSYADKCGDFAFEKTGHWIRHDNGKYHWYLCSCCDAMAGSDERMMTYRYCPNCGAKMESEK